MGFYSPRVVLNDARRFGLRVLPLDVNLSGEWFEVEDDGRALRVGLAYVKEMSAAARRAIVAGRGERAPESAAACGEGGPPAAGPPQGPPRPYTSLADFVARTRVSREIAENLARLGAFDALGVRREELVAQVPLLYAGAKPAGRARRRRRGHRRRPRPATARPRRAARAAHLPPRLAPAGGA